MAQNSSPDRKFVFAGIDLSGNPAFRTPQSAVECSNFRVMPGGWLRLRGGRVARFHVAPGCRIQQIHSFRLADFPGSSQNICQIRYSDGLVRWHWFSSLDFGLGDPGGILSIPQGNDGAWTGANRGAVCNIDDRPVLYNGLGIRDSEGSKPALCSYKGGVLRYFGLDAYAPSGRPSVSFAPGAGLNKITTGKIRFYVGLHHTETNHYSNGVYAGAVDGPPDLPDGSAGDPLTGTITINNLQNLLSVNYNNTERGELKYVFYATIEGLRVPYRILNAGLNGPLTANIGTTSVSLSLSAGTDNGWVLDLTRELETENFPPRRMRKVWYVGGRLYGVLLPTTGSGAMQIEDREFERSFNYEASGRECAAVVWSLAAGDVTDRDLSGDPLQCWPPRCSSSTPSAEIPLWGGPSPDEQSSLVITGTSTFLLTEAADGLHEWYAVSRIHGIISEVSVARTSYGLVWMDQRRQLVMLEPGSRSLRVLSGSYQPILEGSTPTCADYILDPKNEIDRYQIWFADGTSVCHDFRVDGQAYTLTGQAFISAGTITDETGRRHHVVANSGFYTHEAQADTGLIPTFDETFTGAGQAKTTAFFTGRYRMNWEMLGDFLTRKTITEVDLLGDNTVSANLRVRCWTDLVEPSNTNAKIVSMQRTPQGPAYSVRAVLQGMSPMAWKIELVMDSHNGRLSFVPPQVDGELAANFYGSILAMGSTIGPVVNRR
jgi:hypothetical protein